MKKRWIFYISFFLLLLAGFYFFVFQDYDFSKSSLPVVNNNIQPFSFINQDGKTITHKAVEGKVYVAEYFFTTCKGICPLMNANMRRVYDEYKNDPAFMILSHTSMPETDSVPLLKAYENLMLGGKLEKRADGSYGMIPPENLSSNNPANSSWNFVTGDKATLYSLARHSYFIDNNKNDTTQKISDQFIHTQLFALVDKQTRLRGIYDGLKEDEIQKLIKDIKALLKEGS